MSDRKLELASVLNNLRSIMIEVTGLSRLVEISVADLVFSHSPLTENDTRALQNVDLLNQNVHAIEQLLSALCTHQVDGAILVSDLIKDVRLAQIREMVIVQTTDVES